MAKINMVSRCNLPMTFTYFVPSPVGQCQYFVQSFNLHNSPGGGGVRTVVYLLKSSRPMFKTVSPARMVLWCSLVTWLDRWGRVGSQVSTTAGVGRSKQYPVQNTTVVF